MLPLHDLRSETGQTDFGRVLKRLRDTASPRSKIAAAVDQIMGEVQTRRDAGLVNMMRAHTDPKFGASRVVVSTDDLDAAERALNPDLRAAIERAIANVRAYQQHVMPADPDPITVSGARLGLRWGPVRKVGLYVPGGTADLFSTLIMLAVPALVAGVKPEDIGVACPPPTRTKADYEKDDTLEPGDVSLLVLATAKLLGIGNVFRIGGAQAIAALAYGTDRVPKVDLIAGPGNIYVQLAKGRLGGVCGTDNGFYGPSEIVTLADATANPAWVAADLIAQAEHNPGKCFLVAWEAAVIEAVLTEVDRQLHERGRAEAITSALAADSCAVLAPNRDAAIATVNDLAGEHVSLAVQDAEAVLDRVVDAGEVFLGHQTPVAAGDYHAGPSHCLPTGTTARYAGGVSVYTFLKRTGTVAYPEGMPAQTIDDIAKMAAAEGLDGHAESARVRGTHD